MGEATSTENLIVRSSVYGVNVGWFMGLYSVIVLNRIMGWHEPAEVKRRCSVSTASERRRSGARVYVLREVGGAIVITAFGGHIQRPIVTCIHLPCLCTYMFPCLNVSTTQPLVKESMLPDAEMRQKHIKMADSRSGDKKPSQEKEHLGFHIASRGIFSWLTRFSRI